MIVTVYFTGDQFVAFDPDGNEVKDRSILEQISFTQFPGFKRSFRVNVDGTIIADTVEPLDININYNTDTKR
tara:strand:- start:641 stop:856 length:216 start_codon:yes stop_codon:yes gene_type:complete